jgi:hypothetical protein
MSKKSKSLLLETILALPPPTGPKRKGKPKGTSLDAVSSYLPSYRSGTEQSGIIISIDYLCLFASEVYDCYEMVCFSFHFFSFKNCTASVKYGNEGCAVDRISPL